MSPAHLRDAVGRGRCPALEEIHQELGPGRKGGCRYRPGGGRRRGCRRAESNDGG